MTDRLMRAEERIVVALDFDTGKKALDFCAELAGSLCWVKVGLELFVAEGPPIVAKLKDSGLNVFLDLKLHDIPNTVERAARRAAATGASLLTVHAGGGEEMIRAAVAGASAGAGGARVLAVTVLTSLGGHELPGYYVSVPVEERVLILARASRDAGAHGVVASPRELRRLRGEMPESFILLTPGIRFAGGEAGDQKRTATPAGAIEDGADYLVIGRPITAAPDPAAAYRRAVEEVAAASRTSTG